MPYEFEQNTIQGLKFKKNAANTGKSVYFILFSSIYAVVKMWGQRVISGVCMQLRVTTCSLFTNMA